MTTPSDRTPDIPDLLAQSVLPMFVGDGDTPQRIGSCVLLSLFGQHLLVTAKHVFGKRDRQWFFIGRQQSKLIPLHVPGIHTVATPDEDLDVAVVPLTTHHVAAMNGLAFIPERYIEIEPERDQSTDDEFVVFGWPASNSTYRVERKTRNIRQASFYFRTTAARPDVARVEKIDLTTQLLVEFDPKKITVKGRPHTPPKPNGLSGGAVFLSLADDIT
jgi:hypothetical protein